MIMNSSKLQGVTQTINNNPLNSAPLASSTAIDDSLDSLIDGVMKDKNSGGISHAGQNVNSSLNHASINVNSNSNNIISVNKNKIESKSETGSSINKSMSIMDNSNNSNNSMKGSTQMVKTESKVVTRVTQINHDVQINNGMNNNINDQRLAKNISLDLNLNADRNNNVSNTGSNFKMNTLNSNQIPNPNIMTFNKENN